MQQHQSQPNPNSVVPLSPVSLLSSVSQPLHTKKERSDEDFVKVLRKGTANNIICIYEEKPFTVQFMSLQKLFDSEAQNRQQNNGSTGQISQIREEWVYGQMGFQSIPYDCLEVSQGVWIISTKGMPPRLYKQSTQNKTITHQATYQSRKKNSEQYLAPIQMTMHTASSTNILGGGRHFLCLYNLQKIYQTQIFQQFNKINVSSLESINETMSLVGTFQGGLTILDSRVGMTETNIYRPHVDSVMSISKNPQNQFIFATTARKDRYSYIWDLRNYSQNVEQRCYLYGHQMEKNSNQRMGCCFSNDGNVLYLGGEKGDIIGWKYSDICEQNENGMQSKGGKWNVADGITVNNIIQISGNLIFSAGSRVYPEIGEDEGIRRGQKVNSILGCLKV